MGSWTRVRQGYHRVESVGVRLPLVAQRSTPAVATAARGASASRLSARSGAANRLCASTASGSTGPRTTRCRRPSGDSISWHPVYRPPPGPAVPGTSCAATRSWGSLDGEIADRSYLRPVTRREQLVHRVGGCSRPAARATPVRVQLGEVVHAPVRCRWQPSTGGHSRTSAGVALASVVGTADGQPGAAGGSRTVPTVSCGSMPGDRRRRPVSCRPARRVRGSGPTSGGRCGPAEPPGRGDAGDVVGSAGSRPATLCRQPGNSVSHRAHRVGIGGEQRSSTSTPFAQISFLGTFGYGMWLIWANIRIS